MTHLCIGVVENCKNPESYGTICVKCNQCGRFDVTENGCKSEMQSKTVAEQEEHHEH